MNEAGVAPVISVGSCFHLTSMQVCLIQGNTSSVHGVTGGDTKHRLDGMSAAPNAVQTKGRKCYHFLCKHTHARAQDKEEFTSTVCNILSNKKAGSF